MTYETAQTIDHILVHIKTIDHVRWLASGFIWLTGFYILHQMFKLKFLKLLMWSEILSIVDWFWSSRYFFTGVPVPPEGGYGYAHITIIAIMNRLMTTLPHIFGFVGAILGLIYLQKIWKEKLETANQGMDPTR